ncbi:NAD-dependent epimerase/dehydratase family protein [Leptolyngbya sp. FACHB-17]|uniref:NAD-dependent epimerase/dehydratase family protein n=1 Tax=unclassified Leptolyngbya TaxID=2650499 RepID=UPI00167FFC00|nr:NAD-dependent epimerase/dehydratase family protein [Leptolyngbya sp. FACHB-17]MBD2080796.1 NAD-dependent epimerase/dehydratase family protein [Leptolyngbya sp. FACHB-17]
MYSPQSFDGQKVLVTGATGFIGSHLCQRLLHGDATVYGVSRYKQFSEDGSIQWLQADVRNFDEMQQIFTSIKPDIVFHLASYVSGSRSIDAVRSTLENNLLSTVNLLTLMAEAGGRRIILAGSLEEPDVGAAPIPSSPYAAAKWSSSAYAQMFHQLYQVPIVNARIFMVYGPAQKDIKKLIPYVTLSMLEGKAPELSSGQRQIDWIYVEDLVDGLIATAQAPGVEGCTFELGSSTLTPISTLVEQINQLINPSIRPQFGALPDRPMEQVRAAKIAQSISKLGWKPKTSLQQGLRRTVEWYTAHRDLYVL